jgi:hypothetical protein
MLIHLLQCRLMSFSVEGQSLSAKVEPGSTVAGSVTVTNQAEEPVEFELVIEGLDLDWAAVPVPVFTVNPGESLTERFFLKPSRSPENASGVYPYAIHVRSLASGEIRKVPGLLEILAYHHLSVDFNPRRCTIGYRGEAWLEVMVANLGNSEHRVQLFAADQDNLFAFEFEGGDQATLAPGQQKPFNLRLTATQASLLANPRLSPFSVSARSLDQPAVAGSAQGQAQQKALLSPGAALAAMSLFIVFALWLAFLPKPPRMEVFSASAMEGMVGESVTLSWSSRDAAYVEVKVGDDPPQRVQTSGQIQVPLEEAGELAIRGKAVRDGRETTVSFLRLIVKETPQAPLPKIEKFDVQPRVVQLGDGILVTYSLNSAVTQATLEPFPNPVDPRATSLQLTPNIAGPLNLRLIARNADGKTVEQVIKITVKDESLAKITSLNISPKEIDADLATPIRIVWQLENAARAELKVGSQTYPIEALRGEQEVVVTGATTITLTAFDAKGKARTETAQVVVKKPTPPPTDPTVVPPTEPGPTQPTTTGP